MIAISYPIYVNEASDNVRVLHQALEALGFPSDASEIKKGIAGEVTLKMVRALQEHYTVRYHADLVIDEATALLINEELKVRGLLDEEQPVLKVYGIVRDEYGRLLNEVRVQAFDRDLRKEELLGETYPKEGRYEIQYRKEQFIRIEKGAADIVVKVLDANGGELYKSAIFYNASEALEVNVNVKGNEYKGACEWDALEAALTPLLEGLSPLELREDEKHQDVSFLSGETGFSQLQIGMWIVSYHMAEKTKREDTPLEAPVFYGFIQQGQPAVWYEGLLLDLQVPERMELLKDKLLENLTLISKDLQAQALQKALTENIIPAEIKAAIEKILEILQQIKLRYAAKTIIGGGKGTIGQLLELTPELAKDQTKFMAAFTTFEGPLSTFWKQLETENVFDKEVVRDARLNFQLGALVRNHIPLVAALNQKFKANELTAKRQLAKLDKNDWIALLKEKTIAGETIGIPGNMDGDTEEEKYAEFGTILERTWERAYPTTAFSARLEKNEKSPLAARQEVAQFLNANPEFYLDRYRIDHYLAKNEGALKEVKDKEGLLNDLKSIQRVFKLNATYKAVDTLMSQNIVSAQQIYFMGREQFVATLKDTGINKLESKKIYQKAENTYALALHYFGNYNVALNGLTPLGVPDVSGIIAGLGKLGNLTGIAPANNSLPNLQTLFGSLDYCEVTECRSVYSAAAHYVDILRFLGERNTNGTGAHAGKKVKQVLLERRPDLGDIELSCENTNTPLPYIDLVNEILEDIVSPLAPITLNAAIEADLAAGTIKTSVRNELAQKQLSIDSDALVYAPDSRNRWVIRDKQRSYQVFKQVTQLVLLPSKQTHLTAAELRANPEYTNSAAYDKLSKAVFPFGLPYNLGYVQSAAYLNHLGVAQPKLFELFQQKQADNVTLAPTLVQIDSAWLGIAETERKIITATLAGKQSWDFWGLVENGNNLVHPETPADATTHVTGSWIQVLSNVSVMLHRTGLSYKALLQLLDMQFINPNGSIFINDNADANAANCDTTRFTIVGLTQDALNRIHRFIRLWRRLQCSMWELDMMLPDGNADAAVTDKQLTDAVLQDISRMQRIREKLGLDWPVVQALFTGIGHTAYADRSKTEAPAIQTLYQQLFRNKLVDATTVFPESPAQLFGPIGGDLATSIPDKIPGILAAFRITEEDVNLILEHLALTVTSTLSWEVLNKIYRITILSKGLSFTTDQLLRLIRLSGTNPFTSPANALALIELADNIVASGFSIWEVDYLLAHQYKVNGGIALEDKAIVNALKAIREGLHALIEDLSIKPEETQEEYIKSKLGLLPALTKDSDQVKAWSVINGTWIDTPTETYNTIIDAYFAQVTEVTVAKTNLAAPPPGGTGMTVANRFAWFQPVLQGYLLQTKKEIFIKQKIAELLQLEVPVADALLTRLQLSGNTIALIQHLNSSNLLQQQSNGTYTFDINEANFANAYQALRLLHKNGLIISKLKIKPDELAWWLTGTHAADMGWPHPAQFPVSTGITIALTSWLQLTGFFVWKSALPVAEQTAFEFLDVVLNGSSTATNCINALSLLSSWEVQDIKDRVNAYRWDVKQEFKKSASLLRLSNGFAALRKLGVSAARAIAWAKAEPTFADAESIKQAVKARYDLVQWQQVIQPLQDAFREQKRDALVGWLTAQSNQFWMDANALYSYFLIDVEMSSAMLTSRLKQAVASTQLFVQRCLMNLEKDIIVRSQKIDASDTQADSKWKQWKWMKYYRVWEANRKIFLYPENWIEPELRDEKSPFFTELENELMQNDITKDTAEQAYINYLEKLDKVSNLETRAIYKEVISADEEILHVIGRTRSSHSPEYFYRKRINRGRFTAWEKIDLEIEGNHLVIGIHNRRLHLLWPQFIEKAVEPTQFAVPSAGGTMSLSPVRYWEIRMFWSELKKGKWTPRILSEYQNTLSHSMVGGNNLDRVAFRMRQIPNIYAKIFKTNYSNNKFPIGNYGYQKLGKQIEVFGQEEEEVNPEGLIAPANGTFYFNLIKNDGYNTPFYFFYGYGSVWVNNDTRDLTNSVKVLDTPKQANYTVIDSKAQTLESKGTFFYWNSARNYHVDYVWNDSAAYTSSGVGYVKKERDFKFYIHYHPFTELFIKELNVWGISGLLNRQIQVTPQNIPGSPALFNFADYLPTSVVSKNYTLPNKTASYPVEDVDFSYLGGYSLYNWELFFHAPFHIANKLANNQRFEEALEWYHYIFNPTNTDNTVQDNDTPQQKFWITKPFYETTKADYYKQKIENLLLEIAKGESGVIEQVKEWRDNPFNPHLIARMRTVAYQKSVLIKYIQTLIAWGDQLFRQNTIETINEATQLYVMADAVLGPRPKSIPKKVANPVKTYYQLEKEGVDAFGNVLMEVENLLPNTSSSGTLGEETPELPHLDVLYFGIPNNDKLLTLWDTVADRLFKIRHSMNIDGLVQQLPLFDPPIDPGALVRAAAGGLDISSILSDLNAPLPLYRFSFMIQRALDLCSEVKSLGGAMLAALEKKDAEAFSLLRSSHEISMMNAVRNVKAKQINLAVRNWEALIEGKKVTEERRAHYAKLVKDGWNAGEITAFGLSTASTVMSAAVAAGYIISGGLKLIPSFLVGAAGFGGTPEVSGSFGGPQVGNGAEMAVRTLETIAATLDKTASLITTVSEYNRRADEWDFQKRLAEKELPQLDKQIAAAIIQKQLADVELVNHDKQKENLEKELEFMTTKFTNKELYDWMINQLSTVYFQSYQLAYDIAKRAERCFRYELGLSDSGYIQFGYWDSLKKGLLSGEKLYYDLKRLETAYYEQNRREYELSKHISLEQLDPVALVKLRQNGECIVNVPELVYDMDYPGHYFRRVKAVSLSIPCITGPYTTIACTLTLTSNHLRKDSTLLGGKYERDLTIDDPRFRDETSLIQSIATSSAQNDSGMFELDFRDDRYLPFEGAGAIGTWHIKINKHFQQFDPATISDVILHVHYTAREGGDALKTEVVKDFNQKLNALGLAENKKGLFRVYDIRKEFSSQWYQFMHPANNTDDQELVLENLQQRLPYYTRGFANKKVSKIELVALLKDSAKTYKIMLSPVGTTPGDYLTLSAGGTYQGLNSVLKDLTGNEVNLNSWTVKIQEDGATDFKSLPADAITELFLIINYAIS
ncbi:hypothetical protein SAMN05421788_102526 [Filimonas lacunae]|uniref:Virulence plasmid A protein n=1 Tax=Filimonas lacunae TaxID=477680 RepID=A0A173MH76_9BACT|nr:neuraminidase-like domain-containing protein [Filimonas lacunae]BAV06840.1 insecticidal toxin complex protein TccB1 [Filimonas lacunae]SIS99020.1 hypothetical protein SAMN05421788_102526 [Filimonas lacunae]